MLIVSAVLLGQTLVTISAHFGKYSIALCARLILGMGLECQHVVVYALTSLWFTGKEHGFAFAGIAMMMRLGMVSTDFITPVLMQAKHKLIYPFGLALGISLLALCAAFMIVLIDSRNQQLIRKTLKRLDTLEQKYVKKHEHDLDLFCQE